MVVVPHIHICEVWKLKTNSFFPVLSKIGPSPKPKLPPCLDERGTLELSSYKKNHTLWYHVFNTVSLIAKVKYNFSKEKSVVIQFTQNCIKAVTILKRFTDHITSLTTTGFPRQVTSWWILELMWITCCPFRLVQQTSCNLKNLTHETRSKRNQLSSTCHFT